MCQGKPYQGIFSESVSLQMLFASCDQLILARGQITQAERRFRSQLFSAEEFDVIKLSQLVYQAATVYGERSILRGVA
jgi:hypothetical protein